MKYVDLLTEERQKLVLEESEAVLTMRTIKSLGISTEDVTQLRKGMSVIMDNQDPEQLFAELKVMPVKRRNIVLSVLKNILSGNIDIIPLVAFLKKQTKAASAEE